MFEEFYNDKNHLKIIEETENYFIKTYFGDIQVFHDEYIKKFELDKSNKYLFFEIIHYELMSLLKKRKLLFKIFFKNIFDIRFIRKPIVEIDSIENYSLNNHFFNKNDLYFLNCTFNLSNYNDFSEKYFNKKCYNACIELDNGLNIILDFLDIEIIKPKNIKNIDIVDILFKSRNS